MSPWLRPLARVARVFPFRMARARRFRGSAFEAVAARTAFDAGVSVGALVIAVAFKTVFIPGSIEFFPAAALPLMFVAAAACTGAYTRLRRARSRRKAVRLAVLVLASSVAGLAAGADGSVAALWALLTIPSVVFPRVLLATTYRDAAMVTRITRAQHGPILLIGGAGYIGSLTVELLLQLGYRVRVLDRLMYGRNSLRPFMSHENFELIEGDATDISRLTAAARNTSAVIHLAGLVGDPACAIDSDFTRHANTVATRMARDVAQGLGVPRFIFASSCSVYGASDSLVSEEDTLNPVSLYAQTKIDSERELLEGADDDFCVTILRFATVFGYSHRPRFDLVANLLTAQALREGEFTVIGPDQWRPFVHVRDLARAIVMVLQAERAVVQGQIYNVGDDRLNLTIRELGNTVQRIVSQERQVRLAVRASGSDRRDYHVSFAKIRSELGFEATVSLEEGIREMVQHLRSDAQADFRAPIYNNYAMTQAALVRFNDLSEIARLYAPLAVSRTARTNAPARAAGPLTSLSEPATQRIAAAASQSQP